MHLIQLNYFLPEFSTSLAIVANGLFPQRTEIIQQIKSSPCIVACDGAIHDLNNHQITPDYLIGDGDSANKPALQYKVKNPYIYIADQNSNDLSKAVNFSAKKFGADYPLLIFAATGKREDHAVANIALLLQYAAQIKYIAMLSDYGIFRVCPAGLFSLPTIPGQQISVFSFDPNIVISCPELKWPLSQQHLPSLNSGTLNQATAATLNIDCSAAIIVYQAFECK